MEGPHSKNVTLQKHLARNVLFSHSRVTPSVCLEQMALCCTMWHHERSHFIAENIGISSLHYRTVPSRESSVCVPSIKALLPLHICVALDQRKCNDGGKEKRCFLPLVANVVARTSSTFPLAAAAAKQGVITD